MFLYVCTDYYKENEEGMWQGRVIDLREAVKDNAERSQVKIMAVEGKVTAVE
jgi:hypothetical protein